MEKRVIEVIGAFRIVEHLDQMVHIDDLKGDTFNPEVNPDIDADKLRQDEIDFEDLVNREGVFGYVLEKWNPEIGHGWEMVDSCWGFVGAYNEKRDGNMFKHYIVDELRDLANRNENLDRIHSKNGGVK